MLDTSVEEDQEGFHPQQLEVYKMSCTKATESGRKCEPANQLTVQLRPTDLSVKVLKSGPKTLALPQAMTQYNGNNGEDPQPINLLDRVFSVKKPHMRQFSRQGEPIATKTKFNGEGKSILEFFVEPNWRCIYSRRSHITTASINEPLGVASSKIYLTSPYDYNPKLYEEISAPPIAQAAESVRFDSCFESGNLCQVFHNLSSPNNYYLTLSDDTNTHGYNEWFFFRVEGLPKQTQTFHIVNMHKKSSLYGDGLRVSIRRSSGQWEKGGTNIHYYSSKLQRKSKSASGYYFCLTFDYEPQSSNQSLYFALNPPYTVSRLYSFITTAQLHQQICMTQQIIGYTHSNNPLLALKVEQSGNPKNKVVVVTARQHPEETCGSVTCEGILEELLSGSSLALELLDSFSFIVLPMLNPDGVLYGNSRCNLAGLDINRQWGTSAVKELNPETTLVRKYLKSLNSNVEISYFFDLHGHSKKQIDSYFRKGCFIYGCQLESNVSTRLFQFLMSKVEKTFEFASCEYGQSPDKANTIRVRAFEELCKNCYTLETSFYGWNNQEGQTVDYDEQSLKGIGKSLLKSLLSVTNRTTSIPHHLPSLKNVKCELTAKMDYFRRMEHMYNRPSPQNDSESQPEADLFSESEQLEAFGLCQKKTPPASRLSIKTPCSENPAKLADLKRRKRLKISNFATVDSPEQKSTKQPVEPSSPIKLAQNLIIRSSHKVKPKRVVLNRQTNSAIMTGIKPAYFGEPVPHENSRCQEIVRRQNELILNRLINSQPSTEKFQSITSLRELPSRYINYSLYKQRHKMTSASRPQRKRLESRSSTTKRNQLNSLFGTIQYCMQGKTRTPTRRAIDFPLF